MPMLTYKFACHIDSNDSLASVDEKLTWTTQIEQISIDMKNNLMYINARQPTNDENNFLNFMHRLSHSNNYNIVINTDPETETAKCFVFFIDECVEHGLDFDYAKNEPVKHKFVFKFISVDSEERNFKFNKNESKDFKSLAKAAKAAKTPAEAVKDMDKKKK